jgi:peptidoglycan/xylan/chitin deacetylase (PgdA/CDA1 family)
MKNILKRFLLGSRDVLAPLFRFQEISVLCYHSVSDSTDETAVSAEALEGHLRFLAVKGYVFVSLADIVEWMDGKKEVPRKAVALTFDDGHADFETAALPVLKRFNAPATLFVIGEAAGRLRGEPLVEVGYHSRSHPNLEELSGAALAEEVRPLGGERFFAYPGGHYSQAAIEAVKAARYKAAFSIKPTLVHKSSDRYLMPRTVVLRDTPLWELRFSVSKAADWYRTLRRIVV